MTVATFSTTLTAVSCYRCGIGFGLPTAYYNDRVNDRADWYCPNGHGQRFVGETEAEKLTRILKNERDHKASVIADRDQALASLRATRGVVTKLRKRAVAGACPFGCKRHFADLQRHVESRHAGQTFEGESQP